MIWAFLHIAPADATMVAEEANLSEPNLFFDGKCIMCVLLFFDKVKQNIQVFPPFNCVCW